MMNKYIIALAAVAGLTAAGCSSEMPEEGKTAFGTLSTASITLNVSDEDGTTSRAGENVVDTDEFIIEIKNDKDETVRKDALKDLPEAIVLPEGNYTIHASSPGEIEKASWTPYYIGNSEKGFEIKENIVTEVEPVVCKLVVTKITVKLSEGLEALVDEDCTVGVAVEGDDETALTFDLEKIKSGTPGYLDALPGSKIGAIISCTINGEDITIYKEWESKQDTQHHIFEFKVKTSEGEK